jgi:3-oxoacyl-[acyl-carrier protein] reductase
MDLGIEGKVALVCGASRGLGMACAQALASEGVRVTLVARGADALQAAARSLDRATGAGPEYLVADIATESGRSLTKASRPEIDILVTNAGGPPSRDFTELSLNDWNEALAVNFLSAVELIRMFVPGMRARSFGRVINITSLTVKMPVERLDLSTSTRLALTGYTAGVAREVARDGVTINNLLPGTIMTERIAELGAVAETLVSKVPAGRAGKPEEFGAACAFLCSQQAAFITGQNLLVDGGLCALTV